MRAPKPRRWMAGIAIALCAALWAAAVARPHMLGHASFIDPLEAALVDLRFSTFGPSAVSDRVTIVAIDDATMQAAPADTPLRRTLAAVIDRIGAAKPAALAVDILLTDPGAPETDADLARALGQLPTVLAAAGAMPAGRTRGGLAVTTNELWPQQVFSDVADIGMVNIATDVSGTPRHLPVMFLTTRGIQSALPLRAAALFAGVTPGIDGDRLLFGQRRIPLDDGFQMPLRLAGPTGTVPTVSARDLLHGRVAEQIAGKLVVLGMTATGMGDRFPTPFAPALPGVEVIATAISQMIEGEILRRDQAVRRLDAGLTIALAALCSGLIMMLPLSVGVPIGAAALALLLAAVWLAFPGGLWLSAALPLAGAAPPMALAAILRYARERRHATRSDRAVLALKRFQSPEFAEQIARDPDFLRVPEVRDLVILFVDLTGFTALSQQMGATRTAGFLKEYHGLLTQLSQQGKGIVFNYMGDGALVVFGIDEAPATAADHALATAVEMIRETRAFGDAQQLVHPLGCRIGLHFGEAILSRLGHEMQQQLSVTGDSVNLCSRLLEIGKAQQATMVATGAFVAELGAPPSPPAQRSGSFPVRGRDGAVELYFWDL